METLGCIYAWTMWEEQEKQLEVPSVLISSTPGFVILALILAPLINFHPVIAATLLTQANQSQTFTTSQNDPQPEVEGSSGTQPSKIVNSEGTCKISANSGYLEMGSVGEEVRLLQIQLNNWGFPVKNVDGSFGPKTCAAVIRFQERHGLEADGIVGPRTSEVLWASRSENRKLQAQLNNWGFPVGDADGILDTDTRTALVRFQNYRGLEPDAIVGPETSQALWSPRTDAIAQVTPSPSPTPSPTATTEPLPVTASTPESAEAIAQEPPAEKPSEIAQSGQTSAENTTQNSLADNSKQSSSADNSAPNPPVASAPQNSPQTSSTGSSLQEPSADQKSATENSTPNASIENSTDNQPTENNPQNLPGNTAQNPPDTQNQLVPSNTQSSPDNAKDIQQTSQCTKFLDKLAQKESGEFGYSAVAPNTWNIGRYQFGEAILKDLGYYSVASPYLRENLYKVLSDQDKKLLEGDEQDRNEFYSKCSPEDGKLNGEKCRNTWEGNWTELAQGIGLVRKVQPKSEDFKSYLNNIPEIQDQIMREALTLNWYYFKNSLNNTESGRAFRDKYLNELDQGKPISLKTRPAEDEKTREKKLDKDGQPLLQVIEFIPDHQGQGDDPLTVTKSGILGMSHLVGQEDARNFLLGEISEPGDENRTRAKKYLDTLNGIDMDKCMLPVREPNGTVKIPVK